MGLGGSFRAGGLPPQLNQGGMGKGPVSMGPMPQGGSLPMGGGFGGSTAVPPPPNNGMLSNLLHRAAVPGNNPYGPRPNVYSGGGGPTGGSSSAYGSGSSGDFSRGTFNPNSGPGMPPPNRAQGWFSMPQRSAFRGNLRRRMGTGF